MDQSIGDLFRRHGEDYIKIYNPPGHQIKLIRSIRVCRTPALGGKRIICKQCKHSTPIYLSCGNSQCPLCQNAKRELWKNKLGEKFLNVPYVHTVFTIPHELNPLARLNKKSIYNITMRAAWETIRILAADPKNVGAKPGMVAVLHTFGSDMKYHIHVHALITFGGLDPQGEWKYPTRKKRIASFRDICSTYRDTFIKMLSKEIKSGNLTLVNDMPELIQTIEAKRWNVRNEYPTTNTKVLERYLARYINRIAITKSRLKLIAGNHKANDHVQIIYKDYRNKKGNEAAPLASIEIRPLVAINQFIQHVLPPYFQKSRYCGIHSSVTFKKIGPTLPAKLKRSKDTFKILFSIMKAINGLDKTYSCEKCEHTEYEIKGLKADQQWIFYFITIPTYRGPPKKHQPHKHLNRRLVS